MPIGLLMFHKNYMNTNIYFIIPSNSKLIPDILSVCVEKNTDNMRKNNNGSNLIFKLPDGVLIPVFLNSFKAYTHSEILFELTKTEWASLLQY